MVREKPLYGKFMFHAQEVLAKNNTMRAYYKVQINHTISKNIF